MYKISAYHFQMNQIMDLNSYGIQKIWLEHACHVFVTNNEFFCGQNRCPLRNIQNRQRTMAPAMLKMELNLKIIQNLQHLLQLLHLLHHHNRQKPQFHLQGAMTQRSRQGLSLLEIHAVKSL